MLANDAKSTPRRFFSTPALPLTFVIVSALVVIQSFLAMSAALQTADPATFITAPLATKTVGTGMFSRVRAHIRYINHALVIRKFLECHLCYQKKLWTAGHE